MPLAARLFYNTTKEYNMGNDVTIAIPVWNVEPYVAAAVESALTQTYPNTQIMIIDDCGTDRSMEIVERKIGEHQAKDRVQIIRHPENKGLGEARNTAIYNTDTDYLYFLDSDDMMQPSAIERLMAVALATNADIATGGTLVYNEDMTTRSVYAEMPRMTITTPHAGIYLTAYAAPRLNTEAWGKLYKTSLFNDNNIQTVHPVLEDVMLWMQTAYYAGTVATIPDFVHQYRRRRGSICRTPWNTPERQAILRKILADVKDFAARHPCLGMAEVKRRMGGILDGKMH